MDGEQSGPDLAALLAAQGPLEPARAVATVGRLAPLLDAEAGRGAVREITPSDVLLSGDDVRLAEPAPGATTAGGDRPDVAALARVLFESLTGRSPVAGDPTPPSAVRPGLPAELDPVVLRGLEGGYPSCGELAAAAAAALPAAAAPAPADGDQAEGPSRTGRLPVLLGAVAVLAVLAVVLVLVLTGGSDGEPDAPAAGTTTTSAPTTAPLAADQTDDPAQAQLRAIIPDDWINVDCDQGVLPDDGAIAALGCGAGRSEKSPEDSVFYLYPDAATLDAVFLADMERNGVPPFPAGGECPAVDGYGTYEIDDEPAGRIGCFVTEDNDGILVWTRDAGSVEGLVTVMDGGRVGLQVLYDWWVQQELSDFILP
ncbi:hypothetical protein [Blastococcus sp. URHD0036]|uniref:hypothetical protein n=1 Tax=Blastococcus sp. URHD0036 TaxID=1380356 RepID=UPI0004950CEC|nr:hypothetical protein [Blastococcus sp. URHD0036]